jgi:hypothetical protein
MGEAVAGLEQGARGHGDDYGKRELFPIVEYVISGNPGKSG